MKSTTEPYLPEYEGLHLFRIRISKGKKILAILRDYFKTYKPMEYLPEDQTPRNPHGERSLQQVFKQAVAKAWIKIPATLQWLKNSGVYPAIRGATHLLESGTDLRYIQVLLGHKHSKTTEIYTHVSTKSIQKIKSPFDDL